MEKYIVKLTEDEREILLSLVLKGKSSARKLTHARILLGVDENNNTGQSDDDIAILLHISEKTVQRIRKECVENGVESALERKTHTKHKPCKIQGEEEARLITLCCSSPPAGRCRWTLELLADQLVSLRIVESVSAATVGRTLKKMN